MVARQHRVGLSAASLAMLLALPCAHAQRAASPTTPVTGDARKEAAAKFVEGTRAFDAGDFTRAAEAFEAAYWLAPHEDPLWNAARAWHRSGELARAANLYARYLREAPGSAADRAGATTALSQLGRKLARIEVHVDPGVDDVRVDDVRVEAPVVYVVPGTHAVRGRSAQGPVERRSVVEAGGTLSVLLSPGAGATPVLGPAPPPEARPGPPAHVSPQGAPARAGWSPLVVVVAGGITAATAGVAVWSGLDTLEALDSFEASPAQDRLESGRSKQTRTNVLIGTAVGLAVLTGIAAVWLVDWRSQRRSSTVSAGVGLGSGILRGSF